MDALRKRAVSVASPPCACSRGGRGWPAWPLGAGARAAACSLLLRWLRAARPWASAAALSGRVAARRGPCASWPPPPLVAVVALGAVAVASCWGGGLLLLVPVPLSWSQIARFAWFPWRLVLEGWEGFRRKPCPLVDR